MIVLVFTGDCEGCSTADLMIEKKSIFSDMTCMGKWNVYCTHEEACDRMKRKTMGGRKDADDPDEEQVRGIASV